MKVSLKQKEALDGLVAAMIQAGIPITRSTLCRLPLLPYLAEPETVLAKKRGRLADLGPYTLAEATQLLNPHFSAACDSLVQTGEVQVIVTWTRKGLYVSLWFSNDYLQECLLRDLHRANIAARQARCRDKTDPVVTTALRRKEMEALKKRAAPLRSKLSPQAHTTAGALLLGHFLEDFPDFLRERTLPLANRDEPQHHQTKAIPSPDAP